MKLLRKHLDWQAKFFQKGAPLEKLYPLYEANDTFAFTPGEVTKGASHVRDAVDLKRIMITVVVALLPCVFMAFYNTGLQANTLIAGALELQGPAAGQGEAAVSMQAQPTDDWRSMVFGLTGLEHDPGSFLANILLGALYYLPVVLVTLAVGGLIEVTFSIVRGHEVNEGFLVTWALFPLILPPTIPLWQVGLGIAFGVLIGKEIFGGTGKNIFNPALMSRAFLFFAYPAYISGNKVWFAVAPDGFSGPTMLGQAAEGGIATIAEWSWLDAFLGFIPGSMGETSTLACLFGAAVLLVTRVASWRVILGVVLGSLGVSLLLNAVSGFVENPMFAIPFHWHAVMGGWAFGAVFMATDPVSSAYTNKGKWIYGVMIGILAILIRTANPAYPEGIMLAILFMNVFASTIDYYVIKANVKRRMARHATA